jgi:hypothetical protein
VPKAVANKVEVLDAIIGSLANLFFDDQHVPDQADDAWAELARTARELDEKLLTTKPIDIESLLHAGPASEWRRRAEQTGTRVPRRGPVASSTRLAILLAEAGIALPTLSTTAS